MPSLKNNHCQSCNSRTKLLLKQGRGFVWWCKIAKDCPYSEQLNKKITPTPKGEECYPIKNNNENNKEV